MNMNQKNAEQILEALSKMSGITPDSLIQIEYFTNVHNALMEIRELTKGADHHALLISRSPVCVEDLIAERDLYRNCCSRAFELWKEKNPDADVQLDGAKAIVELLGDI